ncbi:MAG TPA: ABC transporter permease [Ignavibacteriaceae bacterium]|nr:ABC transporter permease [Ignavibacteriaceae bacterium]
MNKIFAIAKWEFLEKVKTKTFIISLIITPIIIISFSVVPTLLGDQETERTKIIGMLDSSYVFFDAYKDEIEKFRLENNQLAYVLINLTEKNKSNQDLIKNADRRIMQQNVLGYLFVNSCSKDSIRVQYRSQDHTNFKDIINFEAAFKIILIKNQLTKMGYNIDGFNFIDDQVHIEQVKIDSSGDEGKKDFLTVFFSSFIFILLLMMMVIYSGQMLVRSLIEEKSNRLIEVLVSSCTPDELLAGKILGLSSLGLTQIIIWALIGLSLIGGAVVPPEVFSNVGIMLVYFILGFIFFTTLFVGIGSIVNTEQEAQLMTTYLSIILMFPIVVAVPAIQNPDALILKIFSFIPFTIPSVMLLRVNVSDVPVADIWLTILILLLSTILMIKISAKIFRIGALMHGTKPTMKEIIRWIKSDV